jgi:hypothetical protein
VPVPTPPAAMRPAAAPQWCDASYASGLRRLMSAMPPMRPAPPARPPGQDVAGIASMVSQKGKDGLRSGARS